MPSPSTVIEASRLTVCADSSSRELLKGVNATILAGSSTVLIGRTGSGKSAFLETSLGLRRPASGTIRVLGLDPNYQRSACVIRQKCGIVPQNKALYGNFTVGEMCRFTQAFYPTWRPHIESRLLDRFNLAPHYKVRELAPSSRTLLSATLALAHEPRILILDEPFDDLDPASCTDLLQALVEAASDSGTTLVAATNNPDRMQAVADNAIFFQAGRVAVSVSVETVLRDWRIVTAHFQQHAVLPSLPVPGIEQMRIDGKMAEWLVSGNAGELVPVIQELGAVAVRVDPLSLSTLLSRFL